MYYCDKCAIWGNRVVMQQIPILSSFDLYNCPQCGYLEYIPKLSSGTNAAPKPKKRTYQVYPLAIGRCPYCYVELTPNGWNQWYSCSNYACPSPITAQFDRKGVEIDPNTGNPIAGVNNVRKEVEIRMLYAGEIVEIHFKPSPFGGDRNFFAENITPMLAILKQSIPPPAREYDPSTHSWQIAKEYWLPLKITLEAFKWTIKDITDTSNEPNINVHVPEDYAKNFYHEQVVTTVVEPKEVIAEKLAGFFSLDFQDFTKTSEKDLKRLYRIAARELHPDLGGDADKMAELNRLWSLYNAS